MKEKVRDSSDYHIIIILFPDGVGGGVEITPGGGGRLQYGLPGCVCFGSENVHIMKDALGLKTYPY